MIGQAPIGSVANGLWWDIRRSPDPPVLTQLFGGSIDCPIGSAAIGMWWDTKPLVPLVQLFGGSQCSPIGSTAIGMWWNPPMPILRQVDVGNDAMARRQRLRRLLHRDDEEVLFIIQGFLSCQLHGA